MRAHTHTHTHTNYLDLFVLTCNVVVICYDVLPQRVLPNCLELAVRTVLKGQFYEKSSWAEKDDKTLHSDEFKESF